MMYGPLERRDKRLEWLLPETLRWVAPQFWTSQSGVPPLEDWPFELDDELPAWVQPEPQGPICLHVTEFREPEVLTCVFPIVQPEFEDPLEEHYIEAQWVAGVAIFLVPSDRDEGVEMVASTLSFFSAPDLVGWVADHVPLYDQVNSLQAVVRSIAKGSRSPAKGETQLFATAYAVAHQRARLELLQGIRDDQLAAIDADPNDNLSEYKDELYELDLLGLEPSGLAIAAERSRAFWQDQGPSL